jgi:putative drug exporter of the RND superfamily
MIGRALAAITDRAVSRRGKYLVLLAWLLLAGALSPQAGRLPSLYDQTLTNRLPADAPSQQALALARLAFPRAQGTPALVVLSDPGGLDLDDRRIARGVRDWLTSGGGPGDLVGLVSVYDTPQAGGQLISPDGTTMLMLVQLGTTGADPGTAQAVGRIRQHLAAATTGKRLRAYVTGPAAIAVDAGSVFRSVDLELLLGTVALVLALLVLLYRSPVLPLVPLVAVGLVLAVAQGLLALGAGCGAFPVGQMPANIATVLLFGAGTDYTLFVVSRYREELREEADRHLAMRRTMRAVAEAIGSSAGAVLLAMLTLLLAALGLYSSLGWVLATAMVVELAAGLTLMPALLVLAGRVAFWPFVPRARGGRAAASAGPWYRVGRLVSRRPRAAAAGGLLLLAVLALGNVGSRQSYSLLGAFRAPTGAAEGFAVLRGHMPPGAIDPTTVYIHLNDPAYGRLAAIDAATVAARSVPGVAEVRSPTRPDGSAPTIPPGRLEALVRELPPDVLSGRAPPPPLLSSDERGALGLMEAGRRFVSGDGATIQLSVIFATDPYGVAAIDSVPAVRAAVATALAANGASARVLAGGSTATLADTASLSRRDTLVVVAAVLLVVGLVLAALLRSLVAPVFLLGALILNFLAVVGVAGLVFGRVTSGDGLNYAVPLYTFVFLVSLGADYTIFLMSRVREEVARVGSRHGVALAVGRTGGVISSAGLILAGTFSVLAGLPLTVLFQLGACVAAGILLDTFLVRPLVVPGLVLWLGPWAWWPTPPRTPPHVPETA